MMKKSKKKDFLDLENRRYVYNFILRNPGFHLRKLSRELNIPKSTLNYHLNFLKKHDMIIEKNDKKYLRYYVSQKVGNIDKKILGIIRQNIPRKIILFLFIYPSRSRKQISKDLDKPPTTISYHLKKLIEKEIIFKYTLRGKIVYKIKDQQHMYKLLITYENSLSRDLSLYHLLNWFKNAVPDGIPRRKPYGKTDIEDVEEVLYNIFPHPYHV